MELELILEPDLTPRQVAELAVAAERHGFRSLWHSNYHQNRDAFLALVPAALATSRIRLGVLALCPWEMHPLKIGNALQTLNELSNGRAQVAIGGGGSVLGAIGMKLDPRANRMVRAVREAVEIVRAIASGKFHHGYEGEVFRVSRPFRHDWMTQPPPLVLTCSTARQMLRMAGRVADGTQMSDVTPEKITHHMEWLREGLAEREEPAADFRVGNFWAWHVKPDRERSLYEARRELVFRGELMPPHYDMEPYVTAEERQLVIDNRQNFVKAFWTRSGIVEDVPESIVSRLVAACSSAGDLSDIEREIERLRVFEDAGLTELAIRLFDDPMESIGLLAEHVMPSFQRA
ncbi:MAG: LLM class flavin-dependent oxidoreductase [Chromatiales bacterium]|nr:LLM class flavin-dependent oxidoreductase [Chromatiales bacterium]MCC5984702.1 LLM class flavin-dependent oxidoreductase [Paracoccaceae bacterium]